MSPGYLKGLLILLVALLLALSPAWAGEAEPPTIKVEAEGKVAAQPDLATLLLEVETQAPKSQAAAQENARRSDALLKALKAVLAPEDKLQTLSYRLTPLRAYGNKAKAEAVTGYQAVHRFKVEVRDPARLVKVLDTAFENNVSKVNGPYWGHARLEDLQRQAAVTALEKARRLAEALAQAGGVKIKGLQQVSTQVPVMPLRGRGTEILAASRQVPTPIEVGEEEIGVRITAVFALAP